VTVEQLLRLAQNKFREAHVDQPDLESRMLFAEFFDCEFADLILTAQDVVTGDHRHLLLGWIDRRLAGEPLAYICGRKGFFKSIFVVKPGILIPRPETEGVVERALTYLGKLTTPKKMIVDFGMGSGCIGLSILAEVPGAELIGLDGSEVAVEVSRINAKNLGVSERARFFHSTVEAWKADVPMDLIVANPPYIAEDDQNVSDDVRRFEPHAALFADRQGMGAIESWVRISAQCLKPGGGLVLEVGRNQASTAKQLMAAVGFTDIISEKDLAGIDRVLSGVKRS
jgi:release factor glutamine methyltransferase